MRKLKVLAATWSILLVLSGCAKQSTAATGAVDGAKDIVVAGPQSDPKPGSNLQGSCPSEQTENWMRRTWENNGEGPTALIGNVSLNGKFKEVLQPGADGSNAIIDIYSGVDFDVTEVWNGDFKTGRYEAWIFGGNDGHGTSTGNAAASSLFGAEGRVYGILGKVSALGDDLVFKSTAIVGDSVLLSTVGCFNLNSPQWPSREVTPLPLDSVFAFDYANNALVSASQLRETQELDYASGQLVPLEVYRKIIESTRPGEK